MTRRVAQLLGRDAEIARLGTELAAAVRGAPRLAIVSGEAGIGKSRLLEALADDARAAGCLVLVGRAAEFEADVPFAVLIDAVDAYLRTLDDRDVERLRLDRLGELAAVFPALSGIGPAVDVPVNAGERFRVHRAVGELLERFTARQPVVVVLDDLQWADAASLELAAHLARRPPEGALLLAFGVRSGVMTDDVRRTMASIDAAEQVVRLDLPPLDRRALGDIVGLEADAADRLHELTRGNPFFALQLARTGTADDADVGHELGREEVPAAVQRAIRREYDVLADVAREVASAASVVGDPFDLDLTISAADLDEDAVLDGLDDLCEAGIVRPSTTPRTFEFRHPLVRSAIYQATLPGTRIARHRRIAAHLADRGATPVERARHVEHSARHGDLEAIDVLRRAAESVIAQAPTSAVRWLTTALSLLPASEPPRRRIRLLGDLANAHAALGDLTSGLAALRHSLSIVPADDDRVRTAVAVACADGERLLGRPEDAQATLRAAYESLHDVGSAEAARLACSMSTNAFYLGTYDDTIKWADHAERVATRLGVETLVTAALAAKVAGSAFTGRIDEALRLHAEVVPRLEAMDDQALAGELHVLAGLATAELYLDLYESAHAHAVRGIEVARRSGQTYLMPIFASVAGTSGWMSGAVAASTQILDDAIDADRILDNDAVLAWHLYNRAILALVVGDLPTAWELSDESWRRAASLGEGMVPAFSAAVRGSVLREHGEPQQAIELMEARSGGPGLELLGGGWRGMWLEELVRCHLEVGDLDRASAAVDRARDHAVAVPTRMAMMTADRSAARAALACGDTAGAIALGVSALTHAEWMRSPVSIAYTHDLLGDAYAAAGRREDAVTAYVAASANYDSIGATKYRDRVDAELRRLGHTVHRRTRPGERDAQGVAALTGREMEIAELIRDRATNREIASELFVSLKTVETHVRNIFNKLGVGSRTEVARLLAATADTP